MHHYRNFTVFPTKTRSLRTSDTVEFRHKSITVQQITLEDKVMNEITKLKSNLAPIPPPNGSNQLEALDNLRSLFSKYREKITPSYSNNTTEPESNEKIAVPYVNDSSSSNINESTLSQPTEASYPRTKLAPTEAHHHLAPRVLRLSTLKA